MTPKTTERRYTIRSPSCQYSWSCYRPSFGSIMLFCYHLLIWLCYGDWNREMNGSCLVLPIFSNFCSRRSTSFRGLTEGFSARSSGHGLPGNYQVGEVRRTYSSWQMGGFQL